MSLLSNLPRNDVKGDDVGLPSPSSIADEEARDQSKGGEDSELCHEVQVGDAQRREPDRRGCRGQQARKADIDERARGGLFSFLPRGAIAVEVVEDVDEVGNDNHDIFL